MSEVVTQNEGAFTIAGTGVSLDSVVYSYKAGESPENIQRSVPILTLAQIHDAIAYYLHHVNEIDQYLVKGEREFEKLKRASRKEHLEWYEKLERARKETPSFLEDKNLFSR